MAKNIYDILGKFRRKKTKTEPEITTEEPEVTINGCIFKGEDLEMLKRWSRADSFDEIRAIFKNAGIVGKLSVTERNRLVTEEGTEIRLYHSGIKVSSYIFPHIVIETNNSIINHSVHSSGKLLLESITLKSDDGMALYAFPSRDNYARYFIRLEKGDWVVIVSLDSETYFSEIKDENKLTFQTELLNKLLNLELSYSLTVKAIYEILKEYINIPYSIDFRTESDNKIHSIWEAKIIGKRVTMYKTYSNGNVTEVEGNNYRYESDNSEMLAFKNGKFTFNTCNPDPYTTLEEYKSIIENFKEEMKKLLD